MNIRQPDVVTVAVSRVDGGLTVMRVVVVEYGPDGQGGRKVNWVKEPTPEYIESVIAKHAWKGTSKEAVSWELVPNDFVDEQTDRTFRNAWKHTPGRHKPDHDMPKARELQRERLRKMRIRELDALDIEYAKADEQGDAQEKKRIADRKQVLRDVTDHPAIEAAQTVEELKNAGVDLLG